MTYSREIWPQFEINTFIATVSGLLKHHKDCRASSVQRCQGVLETEPHTLAPLSVRNLRPDYAPQEESSAGPCDTHLVARLLPGKSDVG
jgi:hypothetical protein